MSHDGRALKAFIFQSNLKAVGIYSAMGISKQRFYKLFASKQFEPETIKSIEKATHKKWEDIQKVNVDSIEKVNTAAPPKEGRNLEDLIKSNLVLAEANKSLSDAQKTLTDAHKAIVEDKRELMKMFKQAFNYRMSGSTDQSNLETKEDTADRIKRELEETGRIGPFSQKRGKPAGSSNTKGK